MERAATEVSEAVNSPTLKWFEKHPAMDAYRVGRHYAPYALLARDIRFSDAELAAEFEAARCDAMMARGSGHFWAPLGETWSSDYESAMHRSMTLLRFASAEHFDHQE